MLVPIDIAAAFPLGCRVQLSAIARRRGATRAATGVVVGYSTKYPAIRVLRDKRKAVVLGHIHHWERVVDDFPRIEEHW